MKESSLAVRGKPDEVMVDYRNYFYLFSCDTLNIDLGIAMKCVQVNACLFVRKLLLLHCCLLCVCILPRLVCGCGK